MESALNTLIMWGIFLLYVLASLSYLRDFYSGDSKPSRLAGLFLGSAILLHFAFLAAFTLELRRLPVATLSESIATFVWMTAVIYWMLERRLNERSMGTFILPILSLLMLIANLSFNPDEPIEAILEDVEFEVHVFFMLLAYGAFILSFIASLLHTLLSRELQKREVGVFYRRLPSLAFFEEISNYAVDIGLGFMTIGFLIGVINALKVWSPAKLMDPKILSVFLTWLIYLAHYLTRKFGGWRGQRAAILSMVGFTVLMFSFLLLTVLFSTVHHFL